MIEKTWKNVILFKIISDFIIVDSRGRIRAKSCEGLEGRKYSFTGKIRRSQNLKHDESLSSQILVWLMRIRAWQDLVACLRTDMLAETGQPAQLSRNAPKLTHTQYTHTRTNASNTHTRIRTQTQGYISIKLYTLTHTHH